MRDKHRLHRFTVGDQHFALDPETCFCFECDAISWDVLEHYPHEPVNRIFNLLESRHDRRELAEVVGELEWLRATKSILPAPKKEDAPALLPHEEGLRELTVQCATSHGDAINTETAAAAIDTLFFRSGNQRALQLKLVVDGQSPTTVALDDIAARAWERARLAGKDLTIVLAIDAPAIARAPEPLTRHALRFEFSTTTLEAFESVAKQYTQGRPQSIKQWSRALADPGASTSSRIVLTPRRPAFRDAFDMLRQAGIPYIALNLDAGLADDPARQPKEWFDEFDEVARAYAADLRAHRYYRLDPIADLFWRIYNGSPTQRADFSGSKSLFLDVTGAVYPNEHLAVSEHKLGAVPEQGIDESRRAVYEDTGVTLTPLCMRCWARYLCGGGPIAVHAARTGHFRKPDEVWCDAQRAWLQQAVAAFNELSASGVPFDRIYHGLERRGKPSLFAAAKAVFQLQIGLRPLQEADAPILAQWESWNRAAYFLMCPRSVFIGNQYEREMDALHPRTDEFELMLLRRDGTPAGLFKLKPDLKTGVAEAHLYLHTPADYASSKVRRGFREILRQTAGERALRRIHVYAASWEEGLQEFLQALGCHAAGTLRDAIYTQGRYSDAAVFELDLAARG